MTKQLRHDHVANQVKDVRVVRVATLKDRIEAEKLPVFRAAGQVATDSQHAIRNSSKKR